MGLGSIPTKRGGQEDSWEPWQGAETPLVQGKYSVQSQGIEMHLRLKGQSRNVHWIRPYKVTGVLNVEARGQHSVKSSK